MLPILSWRLSNGLETAPCIEALEEALVTCGPPEIFNSDQGCQFTSEAFTDVLKDHGIKISMDGTNSRRFRRRPMDRQCVYRTTLAQPEIRGVMCSPSFGQLRFDRESGIAERTNEEEAVQAVRAAIQSQGAG